mgnify:CR=1 FL=1
MAENLSDCRLIQQQGGELTPQCRAVLGLDSGEGGIPDLISDSDRILNAMKLNDFAKDYPAIMPGGFLVKGLAGLNDWMTKMSVPIYATWDDAPNANHPVQVIDQSGGDGGSGPVGTQYSVSDLGLGGSFDPSGTGGGNFSGTGGNDDLVF